jgi:hypothetical protein
VSRERVGRGGHSSTGALWKQLGVARWGWRGADGVGEGGVRTSSRNPGMVGVSSAGMAAHMATKAISTTRVSPREVVILLSTDVSPPGSPSVVCHFAAAPCVAWGRRSSPPCNQPSPTATVAARALRGVLFASRSSVPSYNPRGPAHLAQHPSAIGALAPGHAWSGGLDVDSSAQRSEFVWWQSPHLGVPRGVELEQQLVVRGRPLAP